MFPKMSPYRRNFDESKYLSFLIEDDKSLVKYNKIWDNVSKNMKKGFDSKPKY